MDDALERRINNYYEQCDRSYQHWAGTDEAYNLHYGYWDERTRSHGESLAAMNRVMAEAAALRGGERVLDAGCGVGGSALWLAENHDVEVVGLTLVDYQRRKAERFAKGRGLSDRVRFYTRDYLATGLPDRSFDVVWGLESVCHAPDKAGFVREAARLLKPGGRLVVGDGFASANGVGAIGRLSYERLLRCWVMPGLATPPEFEAALRDSGFAEVTFRDITANVRPAARDIFWRGVLGLPVYQMAGKTRVQISHVKGCVYQYLALQQRAWLYGLCSAAKPVA